MVDTWAHDRARERIAAIDAESLGARDLRLQVLAVLNEVVDFDAYVRLLADPVTARGAAPLAACLPELPRPDQGEVRDDGQPLDLAAAAGLTCRAPAPGGRGRTGASRVWREALSRYGIADVASAVFADQFGCWGLLDLWRDDIREPFSDGDARFPASLGAPLTAALRHCQARTFIEPAAPHRHDLGPVVLMLDDDLRIVSRTAASRAWIDVLPPSEPDERAIPASVYDVAVQLLAAEEGVDEHPAFSRTHLADGFWLTLRAARLSTDEPQPHAPASGAATIVVTIEEASAAERLDLFGRALGLSARESGLLGLLARGSDTRAMARQMSLSEHTIQDHFKSIFNKTAARDRVTLLSRAIGTRRQANG